MGGRFVVGAVACLFACGDHDAYVCTSHEQCVDQEMLGVCEPTGFCSFDSAECHGRQYEPNAGSGLAGTCICGGLDQPCCMQGPACASSTTSCVEGTCQSCVEDLAYGRYSGCVLKRDHTVWCLGDNTYGQLGVGMPSTSPVLQWAQVREALTMAPIRDATAIALGGNHACAIRSGGAVSCWGRNHVGQVGDLTHTTAGAATPVRTMSETLTNIIAIEAGRDQTCAIDDARQVWCWGRNFWGQLGDGTVDYTIDINGDKDEGTGRPYAALVMAGATPFTGADEVSTALAHTCARNASTDEVWCWGQRASGALGDGSDISGGEANTPEAVYPVQLLGKWKSVVTRNSVSCMLDASDTAHCSGSTWRGRLGNGAHNDEPNMSLAVPVLFGPEGPSFDQVAELGAGGMPCALRHDGTVWCWGANPHGQLGIGIGSPFPIQVPLTTDPPWVTKAVRLRSDYGRACAVLNTGEILCWGRGLHGELSNGLLENRGEPTRLGFTCP